MNLNKLKNLIKGRTTPTPGDQTNTPIPGCYDATIPSKDTVKMKCSQQTFFKKIINKIIK